VSSKVIPRPALPILSSLSVTLQTKARDDSCQLHRRFTLYYLQFFRIWCVFSFFRPDFIYENLKRLCGEEFLANVAKRAKTGEEGKRLLEQVRTNWFASFG
jgi:hypothetical protein